MKTKHLSELEIQQYVSGQLNCENYNIEHIALCDECKAKADNYQLLFTGIRQQTKPAFNFNLSELVLSQLAAPEQAYSRGIFTVYLLTGILITSLVISYYLFEGYFSALFAGFSTMAFYLAAIAALAILIFQSWEIYRKYEQQISELNSY